MDSGDVMVFCLSIAVSVSVFAMLMSVYRELCAKNRDLQRQIWDLEDKL